MKSVRGSNSGEDKVRMSCLMTVNVDGEILPILSVVPRSNEIINLGLPENVIILYNTNGKVLKIKIRQ